MKKSILLSELFTIKHRFSRSVNIAKDYVRSSAIAGYIITPLSSVVLSRVIQGITTNALNRSWSITGPYGSGKSACCLFLSKILGFPANKETKSVRRLFEKSDKHAYKSLFQQHPFLMKKGLFPILLTGNREPLGPALLRALDEAISNEFSSNRQFSSLRRQIQTLRKSMVKKSHVPATEVVLMFEEFTRKVCSQRKFAGTLIIVDELGKFLEYAALHPSEGDVFILQSLAESANRSDSRPILLVTILHQSFERYAVRVGLLQQREWAKVQGRFENIPFIEGNEQMLTLMGKAITRTPGINGLSKTIEKEANNALRLSLNPLSMSPKLFQNLLLDSAPLHPIAALSLPTLFKGELSQNERSLFAFLSSGEPFGLQDFLHHSEWHIGKNLPFYRIDRLYDYIVGTVGSALITHAKGKRWAEITDAIERLPKDCEPIDKSVLKAIGLLGILGDKRYLKASEKVLCAALADKNTVKPNDIKKSLVRLKKWNFLIHRKYSDTYALWEGSDIDLDKLFQGALNSLNQSSDIASLINSRYQPYPYVAKKHLHEKGTLRYFKPIFIGSSDIEKNLHGSIDDADGLIIFVIPEEGHSGREVVKSVCKYSSQLERPCRELTLFAVPSNAHSIQQSLEEIMAWEWVQKNTPELEGDRIARRELSIRLSEALGRFERLCDSSFDKNSSYLKCSWVYRGEKRSFQNSRELSKALSDTCDKVFHKAPIIHNELVNRRVLSSTAAAARSNLMEHMIASPNIRAFGIEGTPPAMSIYMSVLEHTGIHHKKGSSYVFGIPANDLANVNGVWDGMDHFFLDTEKRRKGVKDLFEILKQPPYGLKEGLLPILLLARVSSDISELALYEDGMFVPDPNAAVFERLIKAPHRFDIQRFRIKGARKNIFKSLASILNSDMKKQEVSFLEAVRPLFSFISKLPFYCHTTSSISDYARRVRKALLSAQEPHTVVFVDLPKALSLEPIGIRSTKKKTDSFLKKLKKTLIELQRAYDILLSNIESKIRDALTLPTDISSARHDIVQRGRSIIQIASDAQLKAFVHRLMDSTLDDRKWIESVATVVLSKPPTKWNDQDLTRFDVQLNDLVGQFKRMEEISIERRNKKIESNDIRSVLLGITDNLGNEYREVVHISEKDEKSVLSLSSAIINQLRISTKDHNIQAAVITELSKNILMNNHDRGDK